MEFTLEQFREFAVGAVRIFRDDSGFHFRRFTERQIDVIFECDPTERNHDTTGIRIDFLTNAAALKVSVASKGKYEVLINNLTVYCERLEEPGAIDIDLQPGENRVTVILPSHCEGVLAGIELTDSAYIRKPQYSVKLAFYGDSITQGWNSEKDSQSYAWLTSRFFDADSRIYGIGGTTFIPAFPEDTGYRPDAVIVAMGTNDYGRNKTMEQIKSDCAAYLERVALSNPGSKLFCVTPTWRWAGKNEKAAGTLADVRKEIAIIAEQSGYIVIDGLTMIPKRFEYFFDKGLHPNDIGFSLYALNLCKILRQYI